MILFAVIAALIVATATLLYPFNKLSHPTFEIRNAQGYTNATGDIRQQLILVNSSSACASISENGTSGSTLLINLTRINIGTSGPGPNYTSPAILGFSIMIKGNISSNLLPQSLTFIVHAYNSGQNGTLTPFKRFNYHLSFPIVKNNSLCARYDNTSITRCIFIDNASYQYTSINLLNRPSWYIWQGYNSSRYRFCMYDPIGTLTFADYNMPHQFNFTAVLTGPNYNLCSSIVLSTGDLEG
jgi:hypothetical protein